MSQISGFSQWNTNFLTKEIYCQNQLFAMKNALKRRGPGCGTVLLTENVGLTHGDSTTQTRTFCQPVKKQIGEYFYAITCDGELYNRKEMTAMLKEKGWSLDTDTDAEIILVTYIVYGAKGINLLNGVFAFAISDPIHHCLFLCRDRFGVKPLFYMLRDDILFFASEPKGIFACEGNEKILDISSINEVFSLGPARTPGSGVFKGMKEVKPSHFLVFNGDGIKTEIYWQLESHPHEDSYETTIETTGWLLQDAVLRQMDGDGSLCTFLSGGIDSSLVSAICASQLKKKGEALTTYSFDFTDNDKNFKANSFQPSLDRPFVDKMVSFLGCDHHYLECDHMTQADLLPLSLEAHDLPPMGDIDSSMLYFCSLVGKKSQIALTGECADEIFGGYPWFHREELLMADTFPWTKDLFSRKLLLKDDWIADLSMDQYVKNAYESSVLETPVCPDDSPLDVKRRQMSWLNLRWFMQTLLNRMDRDSAYWGLTARVPFADHRIVEYLWNVPWEMKAKDGIVKNLLRQSSLGLLPDEVLYRKKSPYPKTYDTRYEKLLADKVKDIFFDGQAPVMEFLDPQKLELFLTSPSDYGKPWYGQLMAGPQMLAYLLQVNQWLMDCKLNL